jgi:hypothetical protein
MRPPGSGEGRIQGQYGDLCGKTIATDKTFVSIVLLAAVLLLETKNGDCP